jgi:hypothetical protein
MVHIVSLLDPTARSLPDDVDSGSARGFSCKFVIRRYPELPSSWSAINPLVPANQPPKKGRGLGFPLRLPPPSQKGGSSSTPSVLSSSERSAKAGEEQAAAGRPPPAHHQPASAPPRAATGRIGVQFGIPKRLQPRGIFRFISSTRRRACRRVLYRVGQEGLVILLRMGPFGPG